ncbi:FMN-dependent NADH-azoreductase [Pseudomonas sp. NPDC090755]|uniref:FMN-dependent NADH-azoreductase n=1 Tax=Pseudomonas sp. NPDC090755 TaxID=3364481 RepID=UPI00383BE660
MKILHVIASSRGLSSESYKLSQTVINHLMTLNRGSGIRITERGVGGLGHVDADYAQAVSKRRDLCDKEALQGTLLQSEQLIRELESADCLVIATPMHNLMVPSALKSWLDHVIQADRTFRIGAGGKVGLLHDRPVFIAISSGGTFSTQDAQQPDYLRPWLKTVMASIGLQNVTFFSVEGTAQPPAVLSATRERVEREVATWFSSQYRATA